MNYVNVINWLLTIGQREVRVCHVINKKSNSWYSYWECLIVEAVCAGQTFRRRVAYQARLDLRTDSRLTDHPDVTGQALQSEEDLLAALVQAGFTAYSGDRIIPNYDYTEVKDVPWC